MHGPTGFTRETYEPNRHVMSECDVYRFSDYRKTQKIVRGTTAISPTTDLFTCLGPVYLDYGYSDKKTTS